MPGIGYECKCGKIFEEGTNFKWEFKCSCGGDDFHTEECESRDLQAKETAFKAIVFKHVETCNKATRCRKCNKPFGYGLEFTEVTGSDRAGTYHKECWAKIKEEEENQQTCPKCGISFKGDSGAWCDNCKRERERESKNAPIVERLLIPKANVTLLLV